MTDGDLTTFVEARYEKEHALEVVAVIAASTITNYAGNMTKPPLEFPADEETEREHLLLLGAS